MDHELEGGNTVLGGSPPSREYAHVIESIPEMLVRADALGYRPRAGTTLGVTFITDAGDLAESAHQKNGKDYDIAFSPAVFELLPVEELRAVTARELAHILLGHLEDTNMFRNMNQKHERLAWRLALQLYPNPRAHIQAYGKMIQHNVELYDETIAHEKSSFRRGGYEEHREQEFRGSRARPSAASVISEIAKAWKTLAEHGECEPVDEEYLKTLPDYMKGYHTPRPRR